MPTLNQIKLPMPLAILPGPGGLSSVCLCWEVSNGVRNNLAVQTCSNRRAGRLLPCPFDVLSLSSHDARDF